MAKRTIPWQSYKKEVRDEAFAKMKSPRLWKKAALYYYAHGPETFLNEVFSQLSEKDKDKLAGLFLNDQLTGGKTGKDLDRAVPLFHREGSLLPSLRTVSLEHDGLWNYVPLQKALTSEMLAPEELKKLIFTSKSLWVRRWGLMDLYSREDQSEAIKELRREVLDSKYLYQSLEDLLIKPIFASLLTDEDKALFLRRWSGTGFPQSHLSNLDKTFSHMIASSEKEDSLDILFESILHPYCKVCNWRDKLKLARHWEKCRKSNHSSPSLKERILKAQGRLKDELEAYCKQLTTEGNAEKAMKSLQEESKNTTKELAQCLEEQIAKAHGKNEQERDARRLEDFYRETDVKEQFLLLESMDQSAGETGKAREYFLGKHGSFSVELRIDKGSETCSTCKGEGEFNAGMEWRTCQACGGSGTVYSSETKKITAREYFQEFKKFRAMRVYG